MEGEKNMANIDAIAYNNHGQETAKFSITEVTPALAAEWLKLNMNNNRALRNSVIRKYAADMVAGEFGLNPDAITFDEKGRLINGQHRLHAVVKSGMTVKMLVAYNYPVTEKEIIGIDRGAGRKTADNLEIGGMDDERLLRSVSTARQFLVTKMAVRNPSDSQIKANLLEYADEYKQVNEMTKMGRSGGSGRMNVIVATAVFSAFLAGEDKNALERFCNAYRTHDTTGCDGYNTVFVERLREVMNTRGRKGANNIALVNIAESYINAFCRNAGKVVKRNDYYLVKGLRLVTDKK